MSAFKLRHLALVFAIILISSVFAFRKDLIEMAQEPRWRWDWKSGEPASKCESAQNECWHQLEAWSLNPNASIEQFDEILADYSEVITPIIFLSSVSTQLDLSSEFAACEELASKFSIRIFTHEPFFKKLNQLESKNEAEDVLKREFVRTFEESGLHLKEDARAKVKSLLEEIESTQTEYNLTLAQSQPTLTLSQEDLRGLPPRFFSGLQKNTDNFWEVPLTVPNYQDIMRFADSDATRRLALETYDKKGGQKNLDRLQTVVNLRAEVAELLGFSSWAEFKLRNRMAKNPETVNKFLDELKIRLASFYRKDLENLRKEKRRESSDDLMPWDIAYYAERIKVRDYSLDPEVIREYFPAAQVVDGMFAVYSELLNVQFKKVSLSTWADDVESYQVLNEKGDVEAYFYTDFYPRKGKYGHAAAFTLRQGRSYKHSYRKPVSAIVANFSKPAQGRPALLTFEEVETLFHEFGHIMHQTLTKAPYATISGTSVARDFVEAPSQMFENWVEHNEVLDLISSHYNRPQEKLPASLRARLIKAQNFQQGYFYQRQLLFAMYDMIIHLEKSVDVQKKYTDLYQSMMGFKPIKNSLFPANFGHLMGGYDAGYYGYLWSKVYAEDLFTPFKEGGILNHEIGEKYKRMILEPGKLHDPFRMIEQFLGRKSTTVAFFSKLGLESDTQD